MDVPKSWSSACARLKARGPFETIGAVEKIAAKRPLSGEKIPPLIRDPREAMEVFGEILKRGRSLYPDDETA